MGWGFSSFESLFHDSFLLPEGSFGVFACRSELAESSVEGGEFGGRTPWYGGVRTVAVHYLEGRHFVGGVHPAIEDEFCCRQMRYPVVLSRIGEQSEVTLDLLVGAFCLTVRLWVVRRCKRVRDAQLLVESFGEAGCELRAAVRDDLSGDAVKAEDFSIVYVRDTFCVHFRCGREGVYLLAVVVNIDNDRVILTYFR